MKTWIAVALSLFASASARAQLELPRPSPSAHLTQTVGLTDITVDYSSPAVNGRVIWGGLVPYDKVWRTGANQATKITFTKDVVVGDTPVPAGSYALFTIPGKTAWTVILNKNFKQNGSSGYKQELDVARLQVTPQAVAARERMAFIFSNFSETVASLDLEWEKLRVSLPIKTKTVEQTAANIKALDETGALPYTSAARYMLDKKDYDAGLQLVEKSITLKQDWLNLYTKAALLAGKRRYKEAVPLAERAQTLGQKAEQFFLADEVKKSIAEWKTKK